MTVQGQTDDRGHDRERKGGFIHGNPYHRRTVLLGRRRCQNPYLPPWQKVLYEAGQAGYKAIELGPYGYLPLDIDVVSEELAKNNIGIVAGTIFDDLLDEGNYENVLHQVDDICGIITKLPAADGAGAALSGAISDSHGLGPR